MTTQASNYCQSATAFRQFSKACYQPVEKHYNAVYPDLYFSHEFVDAKIEQIPTVEQTW
jgi:hypothetical protein